MISNFISCPSSSCCGLYAAWVYCLVGGWNAVDGANRAGLGGSRLLLILHAVPDRDKPGCMEDSLAVFDDFIEAVAMTRLRGSRKSRTGCELRVGASCRNSLAAETGVAQFIDIEAVIFVQPCMQCAVDVASRR